jgi:hypothetical protein
MNENKVWTTGVFRKINKNKKNTHTYIYILIIITKNKTKKKKKKKKQYLLNQFEIINNDLLEQSYYLCSEKINHILTGNYF